jgi:uncharacterized membrane protein
LSVVVGCLRWLTLAVMRKQTLQTVDKIFRTYVRATAIVWVGFMLLNLILAFVFFPSARDNNLWPALGGTTGGFIIVLLVVAVLKAVFHKRVIRALGDQRGSDA